MSFDFSNILNQQQRKAIGNAVLTPFSWVFRVIVWIRNICFNIGLLKEEKFDVPVVSVGNITVGGTGKTPHVEYIIEHLCRKYNIGVLSRGYKRATHGFILATESLSPRDIGDEPFQIFHKFGDLITLAVCEKRVKGIREMLKINPNINLILLDDAFQHRFVKPKVNIVLIDYNRPPFTDKMLPLGFLREPLSSLLRADMVVVTKCPPDIKPVDVRMMKENLELIPAQELFYSSIKYAEPKSVFPINNPQLMSMSWLEPDDLVLGLTGIANPRTFVRYLKNYSAKVKVIHFDDHHYFTREDFKYIFNMFESMPGRRKFIVTTEKDAVRILNNPYFPPTMRDYVYYIPIKVGFRDYDVHDFIEILEKKINETVAPPHQYYDADNN